MAFTRRVGNRSRQKAACRTRKLTSLELRDVPQTGDGVQVEFGQVEAGRIKVGSTLLGGWSCSNGRRPDRDGTNRGALFRSIQSLARKTLFDLTLTSLGRKGWRVGLWKRWSKVKKSSASMSVSNHRRFLYYRSVMCKMVSKIAD